MASITKAILNRNNARVGASRPCSTDARVVLCQASACSASTEQEGRENCADLAEAAVAAIHRCERSAAFEPLRSPICPMSILVAGAGETWPAPRSRRWRDRFAVITGAAGAIGFATAKAFAAAGRRKSRWLDVREAAAQVKAKGDRRRGAWASMRRHRRNLGQGSRWAQVASAFGGVDIAVSNAGALAGGRPR